MKRLAKLLTTAMLTGIGLFAGLASAQTLCVWDPLGTAGDYYTLFKDYQIEAKRWNVNLNLEVYPDDNDLIAKFENGHCDMASILGLRARKFNKFTGTIDAAPGSLDNYVQMRNLLNVLVGPKASKYMTEGVTEVVGILPMGAGYAVTADRSVVSLQTAAGKRVLVPSFADNFAELIKQINVVEVRTEIVDYGRAFKQGKGDIIIMPLALYKPFEIDKVLAEKNGGILRRPLFEFTMQVLDHPEKFPAGFGQSSRDYLAQQTDRSLSLARNMDNQVDARLWIYMKHSDFDYWDEVTRRIETEMTRQGLLDKRMLNLMQRVRCGTNSDEPECRAINVQKQEQEQQAGSK